VTRDVEVTAIGCFDTVGSLGVPTLPIPVIGRAISGVNSKRYAFLDTDLSPRVRHAFHALALDERRAPFTPALWHRSAAVDADTELRQCWFPGCHTNIGGGYPDQEIADMSLAWMLERTRELLDWDWDYLRAITTNGGGGNRREWAEGRIYDSATGLMRLLGKKQRTPAAYHAGDTGECVHVSARVRKQICPGWDGGALKDWRWDPDSKCWRGPGDRTLKEDRLGDVEKELAGRDVVERLLGWAFPGEKLPGEEEGHQVETQGPPNGEGMQDPPNGEGTSREG